MSAPMKVMSLSHRSALSYHEYSTKFACYLVLSHLMGRGITAHIEHAQHCTCFVRPAVAAEALVQLGHRARS